MRNYSALSTEDVAEEYYRRRQARDRLLPFCRYTFPAYKTPPHLVALSEALEAVERGELKRLMVVMPPRHGKSELVTLRFPCWYLAKHPRDYIVQSGYAESIALTHSRKARDVFISPEMTTLFPDIHYRPERAAQETIIPIRQAAHEWGTKQGGSYYAVGIGGGVTGRGFNVGIIDDPVKDAEEAESITMREKVWEWWKTTFRTRAAPGAAIIIVMTRWHEDDLVGRILKQIKEDPASEKWKILHFPAIDEGKALWADQYPIEELMSIKRDVGGRVFESLYQGNPTIAEGELFRREWWKYFREPPKFERIIQSWDTAFKDKTQNDYSVCTTWGEASNGYYLLSLWRDKVQFPELKIAAKALYERDKPNLVIIEDKASGQSLIQELQRDTRIPLLPIKVDANKVARANACTPSIEAGKVFLPESAPWLIDFIDETAAFPNAAHDDQVDSVTQALNFMRTEPDYEEVQVYDAISYEGVNLDL